MVDNAFRRFAAAYRKLLEKIVDAPWSAVAASLVLSALAAWLMWTLPTEYAPQEDRGAFSIMLRAPEGASLEYMDRYTRQMETILLDEIGDSESVRRFLTRLPGNWGGAEVNSARSIVLLENWDVRDETDKEIGNRLRERLNSLVGVRSFVFHPSALGLQADSRPVEMVLGGPDYEQLRDWRDAMLRAVADVPELVNADSNYQEKKPQMDIAVDRDRSAALGVSLATVGRTLETMLGSRKVTTYIDRGREYNVILMGREADRSSPDDLTNLYVRSALTGDLIPLSNLVRITESAGPSELNRHDRMRSITIQAGLAEGVSLGAGIEALTRVARDTLPQSARISWDGQSKEFKESGSSLYLTFGMALLIVFLVLAAQFESFINPLIILVTVPLAMTGALIGLHFYGSSVNVFSQIGAILLIGLSAKNGVLIVEFANQLRDRGEQIRDAVLDAATIRFRPILMTSAATTFGALPLLLGSGAGWESRQPIGIVIVFGVSISALLTLFIVPALYALFARKTSSPQRVSRLIEQLQHAAQADRQTAAEPPAL